MTTGKKSMLVLFPLSFVSSSLLCDLEMHRMQVPSLISSCPQLQAAALRLNELYDQKYVYIYIHICSIYVIWIIYIYIDRCNMDGQYYTIVLCIFI